MQLNGKSIHYGHEHPLKSIHDEADDVGTENDKDIPICVVLVDAHGLWHQIWIKWNNEVVDCEEHNVGNEVWVGVEFLTEWF